MTLGIGVFPPFFKAGRAGTQLHPASPAASLSCCSVRIRKVTYVWFYNRNTPPSEMDWDRVPGVLFSIPFGLNSQTPLIFIHMFLVHATSCPPGPGAVRWYLKLTWIWIRVMTADRKRKDYYDSLEQMDYWLYIYLWMAWWGLATYPQEK